MKITIIVEDAPRGGKYIEERFPLPRRERVDREDADRDDWRDVQRRFFTTTVPPNENVC
jgi:hypothetical protein